MTERPIFVVGFPRSGTTLLQAMLGRHPRIAAPPEVHFFFRIYGLRDYWGDLRDDARVARVVRELVNAPLGLLDDCGFEETRLVARFRASDRSYRALLQCLLDDFAERAGKPRWSEKTPNQRPGQIWSLFPEAQLLHIVRDPREVVASVAATGVIAAPVPDVARGWRDFVSDAMASAASAARDAYLQLRYEDLTTDPAGIAAEVCGFLGETYDASMLQANDAADAGPGDRTPWQAEATAPIRSARSEWTRRLPMTRRWVVSALVDDVGRQLGYARTNRLPRALGRLLVPVLGRPRRTIQNPAPLSPAERYAAVQRLMRATEQSVRAAPHGESA